MPAFGAAEPVFANPALREFIGRQVFTFGPDSRTAAEAAAFFKATFNSLIAATLTAGMVSQQRDEAVVDGTGCSNRPPDMRRF